jgi:hypothetical protein
MIYENNGEVVSGGTWGGGGESALRVIRVVGHRASAENLAHVVVHLAALVEGRMAASNRGRRCRKGICEFGHSLRHVSFIWRSGVGRDAALRVAVCNIT